MKTNWELAVNFAEKVKKIKNLRQIILFGSVARGEDKINSDVDIALIHENKDKFQLMTEVNRYKPDKIQTTFIHFKDLPKETELVGALSGDGLLLWGEPIIIQEKKLKLRPKTLLSYSLAELPQTEKVKLNRSLYGAKSKSVGKNKVYLTATKGITKEAGIEKINDGVLLVERRKAGRLIAIFKLFRVKYKEIPLWTY